MFDLLEKALVLLIVEELLLLEALLQEVNLTVKIIKMTVKTMILIKIVKIILIRMVMMSLMIIDYQIEYERFSTSSGLSES